MTMAQTSREIVKRSLTFQSPERVPVDIWALPWATSRYPEEIRKLLKEYPNDTAVPPHPCGKAQRVSGEPYVIGHSIDDWGCEFENLQDGVIGEVKFPMIKEPGDWRLAAPPEEMIPTGIDRQKAIDRVNAFCASTDKFVLTPVCPRPWERYQFLRGTENAMIDMLLREPGVDELLALIHNYYRRELEFWAETDVDALRFMDDWGSQQNLLIPPDIWRELFKPLYREYCDIARSSGKFTFMHSDGNIQSIYPDLVEVGVSALNSQIFCMDMDELARIARGKLCFWGEIDRQHVLCNPDPEAGRRAVRLAAEKLWMPEGGCFCQFEIGPGCRLETAFAICEEWRLISKR